MANINIGGRLHSTASGNVVAGANEILDDSKGKKQSVINQETGEALAGKQATIEDLSTIRSGAAAGATAYQKPGTGIPKTDLAEAVQTSLGKADTAYQKPGTGVPSTDMASAVQTSLGKADTAYQKPSGGIPASDIASGVIPAISTNIGTDGSSDSKVASPKAVKTYVDNQVNGVFVTAWDGSSTPVIANIPSGVSVTYNTTTYTGTLVASSSTKGKIYLVSAGSGLFHRYITELNGSTYSWVYLGTTAIALSDYATKTEVDQLEHEIDNIQDEIAPDGIKTYNLTLLRDLRVSDQGSGNIKITTNADGYLYYAKVKSGAVVSIAFSIPSGAYYRRGFTTSVPALNVTGVGYVAKASSAVDDSYTAPSDGYIVVDCASGFNSLSMTSPIAGDTIGKEVAQLQSDLAEVEEDVATIDGAVYQNVTKNGKVLAGVVYSLSVGNAPTAGTSSWYNAVRASGLGSGDTIHIRARAGSSYPTWAKLLNGVVVWASEALVDVDETITCDGTFDEIITNSYSSYVANPYCTIVHKATAFELGAERELRVLAIGNSFSEDSMGYIPGIVKKICPNLKLTIGIAYMGGSPLAQHLAYFTGNTITLAGKIYRTNDGNYQRVDADSGVVEFSGLYTFYKSVDGDAWTSAQATVQQFLDNEDWDIITFQQNGANVNSDWGTYYAPYIYDLQKSLYGKITYPTRLGWVLVHGAYGNSHAENLTKWEGGAVNAEKVMEKTGCSILIPYGTAIQNLRTTTLASLGDGDAHDLLADTAHLQDGIGPLAASYTYILAIARAMGMPVGVIGDNTRPDESFLSQYNVPGQNIGTGVIGISADNCFLAQVAADKAVTNPYELTDLSVFQS